MRKNKGKARRTWKPIPTYDQSCKEAAKHFSKVHLAQAFKSTREGTCLSVTLKLLRPKAPSLSSPLHLHFFPFNFPRSLYRDSPWESNKKLFIALCFYSKPQQKLSNASTASWLGRQCSPEGDEHSRTSCLNQQTWQVLGASS